MEMVQWWTSYDGSQRKRKKEEGKNMLLTPSIKVANKHKTLASNVWLDSHINPASHASTPSFPFSILSFSSLTFLWAHISPFFCFVFCSRQLFGRLLSFNSNTTFFFSFLFVAASARLRETSEFSSWFLFLIIHQTMRSEAIVQSSTRQSKWKPYNKFDFLCHPTAKFTSRYLFILELPTFYFLGAHPSFSISLSPLDSTVVSLFLFAGSLSILRLVD